MGGFKNFFESIWGFLSLGARHLANSIAIFGYGRKVSRIDAAIKAEQVELGRKAWELKLPFRESVPALAKLESLTQDVEVKRRAAARLHDRLEELAGQRSQHLLIYQRKLDEQLRLKQPVANELTELQAESRRIGSEIASGKEEISSLEKKIEIQKKRLAALRSDSGDGSSEYMREELGGEIEFNIRSLQLKHEQVSFLESKRVELAGRVAKTSGVCNEFDKQIAELQNSQRQGTAQIDAASGRLRSAQRGVMRQTERIERELSPLFAELGGELCARPFKAPELEQIYSAIARHEAERERIVAARQMRRADSATIGPGIRIGFYCLSLLLIVLIIWLIIILVT